MANLEQVGEYCPQLLIPSSRQDSASFPQYKTCSIWQQLNTNPSPGPAALPEENHWIPSSFTTLTKLQPLTLIIYFSEQLQSLKAGTVWVPRGLLHEHSSVPCYFSVFPFYHTLLAGLHGAAVILISLPAIIVWT